jgi:hypothetical protein
VCVSECVCVVSECVRVCVRVCVCVCGARARAHKIDKHLKSKNLCTLRDMWVHEYLSSRQNICHIIQGNMISSHSLVLPTLYLRAAEDNCIIMATNTI